MRELINKINEAIDLVNFDNIFKGFIKRTFAIYNDGLLYYADKEIPYSNDVEELIITNIDVTLDYNILAAKIISEMFDSFLSDKYPFRYPNYLNILNYPQNFLNIDYMKYERGLLLKGYVSKDLNEKLNYLRMFMNVRNNRELIMNEYIKEEYNLETIEGLKDYCFYQALRQLSKKLAKNEIKEMIHKYRYDDKYFDLKSCNYLSGFLMLMIMDDLKIMYSVNDLQKRSIFSTLLGKVEFIKESITYVPTASLINDIKRYNNEVKEIFLDFFIYPTKKISGTFLIHSCSYDYMVKLDNQIYHRQGVVLENLNGELITLNSSIITRMDENNKVVCYFIHE